MKYKNARTRAEIEQQRQSRQPGADDATDQEHWRRSRRTPWRSKGLLIQQWNLDDLEADLTWCGRSGSPTKVHRIQSVVLAAKESKDIAADRRRRRRHDPRADRGQDHRADGRQQWLSTASEDLP